MNIKQYPSKLLDTAVFEFAKLPGIGQKTALRLVLHLLKKDKEEVEKFGNALIDMRNNIQFCNICHNIADAPICEICGDNTRDHTTICVVESVKEVLAIENTHLYRGVYHVLGGIISPMQGIGPADLNIESLEKKASEGNVKEIIFALCATMEGDTTNFYIFRKINKLNLVCSTLARGVSVGDELEYIDEVTLGRSLVNRMEFKM